MDSPRRPSSVITLAAAGLVAILAYEGYTSKAIRPVPGDVPTYGFGATVKADGSPVEMGDSVNLPAALALAARDIAGKESVLKACLSDVLLTQGEYDAYVSLAYNVGPAAVCKSSIPAKLRAGQYEAACKTILDFKRVQGRDCCAPENARFCGGLCKRRQSEVQTCMKDSPSPLVGEGLGRGEDLP
jgi:lysozyme